MMCGTLAILLCHSGLLKIKTICDTILYKEWN